MADRPDWLNRFPDLAALPADILAEIAKSCSEVSLPAGTRIYGPGQAPSAFLLLIEGSVRVQQVSEGGREIVLYRVSSGESCALTTACLLGDDDYHAEAIAETPIRAIAMSRAAFDTLVASSAVFRRFVFHAFSTRMTNLFRLIDEVAFQRLDIRLAHKLVELSHGASAISVTQQQLAAELGSAREVVSRVLSEFHRRGWLNVERGRISLLDRPAIERLAGER